MRILSLPSFAKFLSITSTIRGRLWAGSLVVIALLVFAGAIAWRTMGAMSRQTSATLQEVQTESRLASQLSSDAAKALEAGGRYLETHDPVAETSFRQHGWNAHVMQRATSRRSNATPEEL